MRPPTYTLALLILLAIRLAVPDPARPQEPDSPVPAADDTRRPSLPPGFERGGSLIGAFFKAPFRPIGSGLRSGAAAYEEHCSEISGGLHTVSPSACLPPWMSIRLGSIGSRSGFLGGGVGFHARQFEERGFKLGITAAATSRAYQEYTAYVGWNDPLRAPWVRLTGFFDLDTRNEFFGLGPDTDEDDLTDYSRERFGAGLAAGVPPRHGVWGEVGIGWEKSFVFEGENDDEPDTRDVFADVPGVDDVQQEYYVPSIILVLDLTDAPGHPTRGVKVRGEAATYRSIDGPDFEWVRYGAEVVGHVPLGGPDHVLSLLGGFETVDPDDGSEVPFVYLPTLGGSERLRGFDTWRWTGEAVGYATVAYRYRIWVNQGRQPDETRNGTLESVVFADFGDVDDDLDELDLDDLKDAYGLEFRMYFTDRHMFGVGIAASDEGARFNIAVTDVW